MHLHDGHLEGGVQIAREGVPWLGASCIAITTAWHFMRWYTAQICVTHALYRIGADVWQNAYRSVMLPKRKFKGSEEHISRRAARDLLKIHHQVLCKVRVMHP